MGHNMWAEKKRNKNMEKKKNRVNYKCKISKIMALDRT